MNREYRAWFARGLRDGVPIGLGYLAVAFTLGIAARNAGLTAFQATLTSFLNNASAGEYAGFTVIREDAGYVQMVVMMLVANARYLLMSCALSQKIAPETGIIPRMIIGFEVTDEIFGAAMSVPGMINPWYVYGMIALALPGWAGGTYFGVVMGDVLPARLVSALSVSLYGMFVAIIIPPARKDRVIAVLVLVAMASSFAMATWVSAVSAGMRVILLTVLISGAAAVLRPIDDAQTGGDGDAA